MGHPFIPSFHYMNPVNKISGNSFAMDVVNYYWFNCQNYSLLADKNIPEIEGYVSGQFSLVEFIKMFKSEEKRLKQNVNPNVVENYRTAIGTSYTCLPLITDKYNSAVAIIQKIPIEISAVATDPYAIEKKQSDINFIKNKPIVEEELQEIYDRLKLGKVDLGATKYSATQYSDSPFGFDLNNADELEIFLNLIYSLKIESAFETVLEYFKELKRIDNIRLLETKDQFKYAVSVNRAFRNSTTGLPDAEYIYPGEMLTPWSNLPDYSDNTHRVHAARITPLQLFDYFSTEIGSEKELEQIINGAKVSGGYCACNSLNKCPPSNFDTFRINLNYIEVKTVDWIGVAKTNKNSKFKTFTTDPSKATEKIWAQNTYGFWWLQNTDKIFGLHVLPFSNRTKGKESFQNFSTNIYKSQDRSAVELSIGENKKAQIADIKLQHAVIRSLPGGRYIDLRFLRGAIDGLKDDPGQWTMEKILNLALEQNVVLGDTEGFDGKNDGQFKAVMDLPGGLRSEIIGYMNIIAAANINISRITGVNQQLTGASANEEGLVGLQKLLINASINALHYVNEAIEFQYKSLFSLWGNIVKEAVEAGGATKQSIVNVIGSRKVNIIDGLDDVGLHEIGIFVKIKQREEERQLFRNKVTMLEQKGVLSAADEFMVNNISNPKDQWAFIAVKEQQYNKRQDAIRQENLANTQQVVAQQGQNQVQAVEAETAGDIKKIYAKGQVEAQITNLAGQLGMSQLQMEGLLKKNLQTDRNKAQTQKNIETLIAKSNLQQQEVLT